MKLISVIIPMYNAEKFIGRLLNCIKLQTYLNLDVIIIDDGSTDKSIDIANAYALQDNRITIIQLTHAGVGNARNIGIEKAKGQYITFLDADDYIENDMYEKIIGKIKEVNPNVLRYNYIREDINGNRLVHANDLLDLANRELKENEIKTKLLSYIFENKLPTYMPLVIAKAEFIKNNIKFRTDINLMEDLIFFLELVLSVKSIYLYDYKCYHYVRNNNSSTKSRSKFINNCYDIVTVIHLLEKMLKENDIYIELHQKIYYVYSSFFIKHLIWIFEQNDQYTISYEQLIKIIKDTGIRDIIIKTDFSECQNESIRLIANYIENEQYEEIYSYVQSISI